MSAAIPWKHSPHTCAALIREMASRPDGVTSAEIVHACDWTANHACSTLNSMTRAKHAPLYQRCVPGYKNRFFTREDLADHWVLTMQAQPDVVAMRKQARFAAWEAEKAERKVRYAARLAELKAQQQAEKDRLHAAKLREAEKRAAKRLRQRQEAAIARAEAARLKAQRQAREKAEAKALAAQQRAQVTTPKLHTLGHLVPGARDMRGLTIKEQPGPYFQKMAEPVKVAREVDYSRAVVTICPSGRDTRFVAEGPVFSVLNPNECRPWAKAATA